MEDFSSTVEHLELPRQHVHFDRNAKRAKPCKKGRESLIWFCSPFQFQERVLFAPFWSSKCSNRPCSGFLALQGSLKCHGIAVKTTTMAVVQLPKSLENRSTTTPLVGTPGRPCLRWTSRNVFFVTQRKKTKSCWSHEALTCCTLESSPTILLSAARILIEDDVCSSKSTSWQTFMRRKWCIMPLPTESTPAPSPWTPLPLPTRRIPKVLLIIQRLSPMTATRHVLQMSYLNDRGVDHRCFLYYESIKTTLCHMYGKLLRDAVQEKAVRGYSLKSLSHMMKWHFDMRLVFHRPNKCTESQYVFSSEVQPGPIIEGCLRLDEAQEKEEEKELAMKWCAWWAESQWCIRWDTACV